MKRYRKDLALDYVLSSIDLQYKKYDLNREESVLEDQYDSYSKASDRRSFLERKADEDGYSEGDYGVMEYFDFEDGFYDYKLEESYLKSMEKSFEISKLEYKMAYKNWRKIKKQFEIAQNKNKNVRKFVVKSGIVDSIEDCKEKQCKELLVSVYIEDKVYDFPIVLRYFIYPPYFDSVANLKKESEIYIEGRIEQNSRYRVDDFKLTASKVK